MPDCTVCDRADFCKPPPPHRLAIVRRHFGFRPRYFNVSSAVLYNSDRGTSQSRPPYFTLLDYRWRGGCGALGGDRMMHGCVRASAPVHPTPLPAALRTPLGGPPPASRCAGRSPPAYGACCVPANSFKIESFKFERLLDMIFGTQESAVSVPRELDDKWLKMAE